jgi:SEC-C motif domain protein
MPWQFPQRFVVGNRIMHNATIHAMKISFESRFEADYAGKNATLETRNPAWCIFLRMSSPAPTPCPCGLPAHYEACCGRFHDGLNAPTPEALMRSRYSAFALGLGDYLLATWHVTTRPAALDVHTPPQPRWIGLKVLESNLQDSEHGTVHFIATCRVGGRAQRMEERSRFVRENGQWFYVDGIVPVTDRTAA